MSTRPLTVLLIVPVAPNVTSAPTNTENPLNTALLEPGRYGYMIRIVARTIRMLRRRYVCSAQSGSNLPSVIWPAPTACMIARSAWRIHLAITIIRTRMMKCGM